MVSLAVLGHLCRLLRPCQVLLLMSLLLLAPMGSLVGQSRSLLEVGLSLCFGQPEFLSHQAEMHATLWWPLQATSQPSLIRGRRRL